jgi:aminopeptidase N
MNLLNPHSYQKGAWFLHMLRNKIGDESFWKSIRAYYKRYQYGNASTADFKQVVEEITHDDLSEFFNQWLHQSQHPKIRYNFNNYGEGDIIGIYQRQNNFVYKFNLEIELTFEDGTVETKTFYIDEKTEILYINEEKLVSSFRLDPNVKLLYEFIAR